MFTAAESFHRAGHQDDAASGMLEPVSHPTPDHIFARHPVVWQPLVDNTVRCTVQCVAVCSFACYEFQVSWFLTSELGIQPRVNMVNHGFCWNWFTGTWPSGLSHLFRLRWSLLPRRLHSLP
jgi:hypothetical protein